MRFMAAVVLGMILAAQPLAAKDAPVPMLNTGGHMALIRSISFTPDGQHLVSASDDKTIRVWDAARGETVRIIRGEVAPGTEGKAAAVALSPDGKWLAAAGWFSPERGGAGGAAGAIRLYDFASGRLMALLKGHKDVVRRLAFSPDGRHLISGSDDFTAIIWDMASNKELHRLQGHRDKIYGVGFSADGTRAVTGSDDHELRLWLVESGALLRTIFGHREKVRSLAIVADGRFASGDASGEIRLWDGGTGAFLKTLARQETMPGSLSFSPDGKLLLSSCGQNCGGSFEQIVYDTVTGRQIAVYRGHDNTVFATAISPDGRWAATGGGASHEIHIWDLRTGERRKDANGRALRLGGGGRAVWAAGFSADGRRIGWGHADPCPQERSCPGKLGPLQYALTLPVEDAPLTGLVEITGAAAPSPREGAASGASAWHRAAAERGGFSLHHREGGNYGAGAFLDVRSGGKVIASIERGPSDGYEHRCFTFIPDGAAIISGASSGWLTAYGRDGKKLGDFVGHDSDVMAVAPSPDGRYLLSGAVDQTLRLWNLATRELIVSFYHGDDGAWVIWTPQGYYAASGAGAELIGWQINRGLEHAAGYVSAAQLRAKLHRPDIVAKAIQLASAEAALRQSPGMTFEVSSLITNPMPDFRIVSPAADTVLTGRKTQLELVLEPAPDPVIRIRIEVNGVQVAEHRPPDGASFNPGTLKFQVPLGKGRNMIRVVAVNQENLFTPEGVTVTVNGGDGLE